MSGRVRLTGRLICTTLEESRTVLRLLPDHLALTRAEPGCISFSVMVSADPLIWTVEEEFSDQAAFDAHQARTKASIWARETVGIRRDYRIETGG